MKRTNTRKAKTSRSKATAARGKGATARGKTAATRGKRTAARTSKTSPRKRRATTSVRLLADRDHVHQLLEGFENVMVVTLEGEGPGAALSARPMRVADLGDDCSLTFVTSAATAKVDAAGNTPLGLVVAQSRTTFLSLRGRSEVVHDRQRIEQVWRPAFKVYFPEGMNDPNLCLLVFHPEEAELWDVSGARGLRFLFDAAKALLTGEPPTTDSEQHTHVDLGGG